MIGFDSQPKMYVLQSEIHAKSAFLKKVSYNALGLAKSLKLYTFEGLGL